MQAIGENTVLAQRYALTRKLASRSGDETDAEPGSSPREVWIATDSTLDREVTATVFPADFEYAEAALDSARRAAGVEDHHLPRVLDVGTENGTAYVISEALHGSESIAAMLQFDSLPAEEVRRLIGESASGLGSAAVRGLHHLQLTPHDIVCSPTGAVSVLGLPTDAALAGADDLPADEASRIDTLDLVRTLYAGLTGLWPGDRPVPGLRDVTRRADGELPAPSELVPGVPGDLDALCRTTLNADEGPRTPSELARQLAPWSSERVTASGRRPTGADERSGAALQSLPGGNRRPGKAPRDDRRVADSAQDATAEVPVGAIRAAVAADGDETTQLSAVDLKKARERTATPPVDPVDDYDPSFTELEPPVPGLGGDFEPDRKSSRLALVLIVLLVLVAMVFAAVGLRGIGRSSASSHPSTHAPAPSSSGAHARSSSAKPAPAPKLIPIAAISAYGVGGGQYTGYASLATDSSPDTYWRTFIYRTANFGGLTNGTGLLLNLGSTQAVKSLKITTTGGDSTIKFFLSDQIEAVSTRTPAATATGSGTQTVDLGGAKGKYLTIWVTSLSKQADGSFQERINDVKVYS
ncbi:hypothetical protein [Flexivirga caeni]|uniref:Protein kinase domain-containing protein n=1 Tax=Flexivirga caeni TaxID=2294115 RepID=A0A3M9M2F0_9MICO|nr:hypothetical protein [Flexivirga caeni]RNI19642.1 hypothetical protein EFY87_16215 [Flexivirga caeni]